MFYNDAQDAIDSMAKHPEQQDDEIFIMNVSKDYKITDGYRLGKKAYDVFNNPVAYSVPLFKKDDE